MQNRLKELLLAYEISVEIVDAIILEFMTEFDGNFVEKTEVDALVLTEKNKILLETAVLGELNKYKAKNIKACYALIDFDKIEIDGDEIIGLSEQVSKIRKENPFLFEENVDYSPKITDGPQNFEDLSDEEYFNFLKYRGE